MGQLTYTASGVDYDLLDGFKRACQRAAATTTGALAVHGLVEPPAVRGESAYLVETADAFLAHVEEGLGTKVLVADAVHAETGRSFYRAIGVDTVAAIVNDLVTCGALPLTVAMHAAVGDARWFADAARAADLAAGFAEGCRLAGAVWGGGETPALRDVVAPDGIVLAGSALGRIAPKAHRITGEVRAGDAIVLVASAGVHTNGITLCRAAAAELPAGWLTPIGDGRPFGEALLDASVVYVGLVAACQRAGIPLRYAVHVTGHGWRKLMRLEAPLVYRITTPGTPPPVLAFLVEAGLVDRREAYGTFNMGAGFALYVAPADAERTLAVAQAAGYRAWVGGRVEDGGGRRAVEIVPLGLVFEAETLRVR
ncbi:MAG TPA: AIR synthase-related protein [Candidatus Binatia bacterium]|nr:AIR synthase-related protein [Candidatus Binatia bacterium]